MLRTVQSLPLCRAFDTGLRPDPFPDRAASLLPGLLAATRTGLPPASDDELTTADQPPTRSTSCLLGAREWLNELFLGFGQLVACADQVAQPAQGQSGGSQRLPKLATLSSAPTATTASARAGSRRSGALRTASERTAATSSSAGSS